MTELWLQRAQMVGQRVGEAVGSVASQGSGWALLANPLPMLL